MKTHTQNTSITNHIYLNLRNRRHLWFKFSEYSVAKNIKIRSRSNTTKLCAFVPLCLCHFSSNIVPQPPSPVILLTPAFQAGENETLSLLLKPLRGKRKSPRQITEPAENK